MSINSLNRLSNPHGFNYRVTMEGLEMTNSAGKNYIITTRGTDDWIGQDFGTVLANKVSAAVIKEEAFWVQIKDGVVEYQDLDNPADHVNQGKPLYIFYASGDSQGVINLAKVGHDGMTVGAFLFRDDGLIDVVQDTVESTTKHIIDRHITWDELWDDLKEFIQTVTVSRIK